MSEFNFKSQIATSREQSERLLALGLKKETADMHLQSTLNDVWSPYIPTAMPYSKVEAFNLSKDVFRITPAWSLGRLLDLIKHSDICYYNDFGCIKLYIELDDFETCITMISYMVEEGHFNKEYLV